MNTLPVPPRLAAPVHKKPVTPADAGPGRTTRAGSGAIEVPSPVVAALDAGRGGFREAAAGIRAIDWQDAGVVHDSRVDRVKQMIAGVDTNVREAVRLLGSQPEPGPARQQILHDLGGVSQYTHAGPGSLPWILEKNRTPTSSLFPGLTINGVLSTIEQFDARLLRSKNALLSK